MTISPITSAFDGVMQVGECPLWHPREQVLYWVDIDGMAVHRLDPASGAHRSWSTPSEPSALAWNEAGGLTVALREGFAHLDTGKAEGALTPLAPAPFDMATARFNDGKVDPAGRFWVGTIYEPRDQPAAAMYCLERGQVRLVWEGGMTNSNGLGFSPDGSTLYHADTTAHRVDRYPFNAANGALGQPLLLQQFASDKSSHSYGGRPDGAAVDSDGNYWCAMFEGGRLLQLSPAGDVLAEVALPVRCPTMLAFGGADYRTLYVTTASHKRPAAELAAHPLTGQVLTLRVDVAGRPEPAYIG
jgi:sugar lactone lactonase YvrE